MADRKLPELRTRIRLDTSDLDKADSRIARFTRNFSDPKAMAGYQARLRGIGDTADEVGSKLTRSLTLPIAAAGVVSVKLASDFNKSFTTMTSLAGVATDELEGLKEEVKALAQETGRSPTELANALYFIRSAGLDGAEAMDALRASAKGAAIGLGETQAVADAATSAVNAYGSENLTASQAVDQLAAAVAEGKGEAAAFAPQIGQILPLAKQLGVEFSEVAGAMAYFTKTGTPVAQAATMVQGVLQKLIAPTQQGRDVLTEYGVSLEQLKSTVSNQGLLAGLQLLNDKVGGDPQALRRIFDDIEGYTGVLGLLRDGGSDAAEVLDNVANSADTVAEAFARVQGTDEFKAQQAITDLQVAAIELGQTLIPIVADLAEGISGIASAFASLPQPVQTALLSLVGTAAILGPLAKGLGLATTGVSLLIKAAQSKALDNFRLGLMGVTQQGAGTANAVGAVGAAMAAHPVIAGAAVVGILGLAYAYTRMESDADKAADAAKRLAQQAADSGQTAADLFVNELGNALSGLDTQLETFGLHSNQVVNAFGDLGIGAAEVKDALQGSDVDFQNLIERINEAGKSGSRITSDAAERAVRLLEAWRVASDGANATDGKAAGVRRELGIETESASDATAGLTDATEDTTDAFKEEADAARALYDAHRSVADSAEGVADAQAELDDARRAAAPGSEENRRALEAVADAERAVRDAQAESADAQRDLSQARKDAIENLEDLALAASGAQVAETGAAIALERAKSDLLKAKTPLDKAEAEQRIREAEQALAEAKDKTGDSASALAEARAKGIEGSDAVVAAQERITAAREGEREAQGRLAEAATAASETQRQASEKVQEATENLTEAQLDHIDAQADLVEQTDGASTSTDVLIVRLTDLARKLDPADPLRKNLTDYIADLREMRGLQDGNTPANGSGTASLGESAPPGAVNAERLLAGGGLRTVPTLPDPGAVAPVPATGNVRTAAPARLPDIIIPITVTGQPDAQTLAQLREVASDAAESALRKVTVGG